MLGKILNYGLELLDRFSKSVVGDPAEWGNKPETVTPQKERTQGYLYVTHLLHEAGRKYSRGILDREEQPIEGSIFGSDFSIRSELTGSDVDTTISTTGAYSEFARLPESGREEVVRKLAGGYDRLSSSPDRNLAGLGRYIEFLRGIVATEQPLSRFVEDALRISEGRSTEDGLDEKYSEYSDYGDF